MPPETRSLSDAAARELGPGSEHYTAYVGPPEEYDLMGATQFMLLVSLGLRASHRVLDFGCGSLRVGRLLIPYLAQGNYHGVEPNTWLVEDAIARQIGHDQVALKWPHFHTFDDFIVERCGIGFDYVIAQSIFSHLGRSTAERLIRGFGRILKDTGIALVTFIHPGQGGVEDTAESGWVYPNCVAYAPPTIKSIIDQASLVGRRLPWFHPRQTWYALAKFGTRLPDEESDRLLSGAVLNVPTWRDGTQ
jgi:cyclopropane fatty-acyl-phospholipid synthase-like methyltransferase